MIEIEKPKMVTAEISEDGRYGKFVWEPLERGYGITLGNSLRRVLLSSLMSRLTAYCMSLLLFLVFVRMLQISF